MFKEFIRIISGATLTLPALEITALLTLLTLCMVLKLSRIGLFAGFLFAYRWGWMVFVGRSPKFLFAYLMFGTLVGILTVVNVLSSTTKSEE